MEARLARRARERAGNACQYSQVPQAAFPVLTFHVDHIIALQHGGRTNLHNLALACVNCNAHKGPNIAGNDPATRRLVRLFKPRRQRWSRHFRWHGPRIVGRTAVGRVTVGVLNLNAPEVVAVRATLIADGLLTPDG